MVTTRSRIEDEVLEIVGLVRLQTRCGDCIRPMYGVERRCIECIARYDWLERKDFEPYPDSVGYPFAIFVVIATLTLRDRSTEADHSAWPSSCTDKEHALPDFQFCLAAAPQKVDGAVELELPHVLGRHVVRSTLRVPV